METQVIMTKQDIESNKFIAPYGNRGNNKPRNGGLWTSSLNDDNKSDWIEFVEREGMYESLDDFGVYHAKINPAARILFIHNQEQYMDVLEDYGMKVNEEHGLASISNAKRVLDFDKLMKDYDALSLTETGLRDAWDEFYGWDCESTVWFNIDCFDSIEKAKLQLA